MKEDGIVTISECNQWLSFAGADKRMIAVFWWKRGPGGGETTYKHPWVYDPGAPPSTPPNPEKLKVTKKVTEKWLSGFPPPKVTLKVT